MAYRAPRYSYVHAAREAGVSAIDLDGDSAHADFPIDNLIDDRASTLFRFSGVVTDPNIDIDLGTETGINRLIIPANHNISSIKVWQDGDVNFGTPWVCHNTDTSITPGVLYDSGEFDNLTQSQQHIRIDITGTLQFQIPQIILTKIKTLTVGPTLADSVDAKRDNVTRIVQNTGIHATIKHGPQQRYINYTYEYPLSSTDLATLEAMIDAVGMERPFWVDPASFSETPDTDDPPIWMLFREMPEPRLSVLVPMAGQESKTFQLELIESVA